LLEEERGSRPVMDPTDLWRRWYEASTKLWSDAARGARGGHADPAGFYRQWFDNVREAQERMIGAAPGAVGGNPGAQDLWRRWFETTTATWQKGAEVGQNAVDLLPRWTQMLEEARDNLLAGGNLPADPLQFATRWYNATNGPFSDFVGDIIEREEFLGPSSQLLQSYASFYKVFKRNSEEYLKNLQLPVRSDISRIAGLVVNLEDKVDNVEEILEDLDLQGKEAATTEAIASLERRIGGFESALERAAEAGAQTATAGSVRELEGRLDRVEGKLDRLLAALENQNENGASQATDRTNGSAAVEVKATDAARRKARELGVILAEVEGTGADGQVTIEDVRKKGDG
jgi:e3 binding domain